jgi:hypothetical protein
MLAACCCWACCSQLSNRACSRPMQQQASHSCSAALCGAGRRRKGRDSSFSSCAGWAGLGAMQTCHRHDKAWPIIMSTSRGVREALTTWCSGWLRGAKGVFTTGLGATLARACSRP